MEEKKYDLCCIGHITLDKIVTQENTFYAPGGTAFYFSHALSKLNNDIDYLLVSSVGSSELSVIEDIRNLGINTEVHPSKESVYFENIYGENQDNRSQRVLAKADQFKIEQLKHIDSKIYHLGALLADDFHPDVIPYLAKKGKIGVDSQGYLREVRNKKVYPVDWDDKLDLFPHIHFLKVNEEEMETLTGYKSNKDAAKQLYDWGIKEVLITMGSLGSIIYDGKQFYPIPAYHSSGVVDATGCGDTYTTGYLYMRSKGASIEDSGKFAAAMSTLKIESSGPFKDTEEDIKHLINTARITLPNV